MTQNLMNKSLNMGCGLVISHSVWACVRPSVSACESANVDLYMFVTGPNPADQLQRDCSSGESVFVRKGATCN